MPSQVFAKLIKKEKINEMPPFTELGLEPWDKNLTSNYLKDKFKNKKIPIKLHPLGWHRFVTPSLATY